MLCYLIKGMLEGEKLLAVRNNFTKHSLKAQSLRMWILTRISKEFGTYGNIKNIEFSLLIMAANLEKPHNFVPFTAHDPEVFRHLSTS